VIAQAGSPGKPQPRLPRPTHRFDRVDDAGLDDVREVFARLSFAFTELLGDDSAPPSDVAERMLALARIADEVAQLARVRAVKLTDVSGTAVNVDTIHASSALPRQAGPTTEHSVPSSRRIMACVKQNDSVRPLMVARVEVDQMGALVAVRLQSDRRVPAARIDLGYSPDLTAFVEELQGE
jgi:hypothetical protein